MEKVSSEFENEVMSDLTKGRAEASSRIEVIRKDTSEKVAKILEGSAKQADAVKRQILGTAELEARNAQLRSLEKVVNEVFEDSVKEVSGSLDEKSLSILLSEGIEVIGPKAKVYCSKSERKIVSSVIGNLNESQAKLTLEEEPIDTIGGVVLTSPDGTIRFDNTLEARLERMRPLLRKEVAGVLTGAG